TVEAFVLDSGQGRSVRSTGGALSVAAQDSAGIFAQSGAVSIAWGGGTTATTAVSVSLGASVTLNDIVSNVRTFIDGSVIGASGDVTLSSTSGANVHSLAVGGSVSKAK